MLHTRSYLYGDRVKSMKSGRVCEERVLFIRDDVDPASRRDFRSFFFFSGFCLGLVEVRTPFLFIYVGISYGGGYASTEFSG